MIDEKEEPKSNIQTRGNRGVDDCISLHANINVGGRSQKQHGRCGSYPKTQNERSLCMARHAYSPGLAGEIKRDAKRKTRVMTFRRSSEVPVPV